MIINNLQLTLRRFARQKLNTVLHIVGLTLGISVCTLIGLFLHYELSFDNYHNNADRICRVNSVWTDNNKKDYHFSTPTPLAGALRSEVSGLQRVVLAHPQDKSIVEITPERRFLQDHVLITEPEFLDVFKVHVLKGNGYAALRKPYQALLTEETAKKFFGNEDPVGKTFKYKNDFTITVAGVIHDFPSSTHLPASMLLSYVQDDKFLSAGHKSWTFVSGTATYVVLPGNYNRKNLEVQLKRIADKNINSSDWLKGFRSDFDIQPLSDIHFNSKYAGGSQWVQAVNVDWLWFFAGIGIAVLILACINFVNLSTAQALTRAKEVGVRKSLGADRYQLIGQFLKEAWLLSFIAGVLSIFITKLCLPSINTLLEKHITFDLGHSSGILLTLLAGILFTGLLAGLYPAWVIAKFNPAIVLKTGTTVTGDQRSAWLRKGLVVTQFAISAGLLIAVFVIAQQVSYMHRKNLGFDKDNIITTQISTAEKAGLFGQQLKQIPHVKDVSFATAPPSSENHWSTIMSLTNSDDPNRTGVKLIIADDEYGKLYGLKLLSGRFLQASDTNYISPSIPEGKRINRVVVNEKLVQTAGFASNKTAVGKRIWLGWGAGNTEIVGVVANFNVTSLHDEIAPTVMGEGPQMYGEASIKIEKNSDLPQTITGIETAWKKTFPGGVFTFKFLDEQIDAFYKSEERLYTLFKIFAGLAMLISCLGLWGLASFAAQQRTKEIGIRKVLGASVVTIVTLLSKDFLKMVALALVIASPVAWYFMHQWLQDFAYRVNISWWIFCAAALLAVFIALATISFQAIKAAITNPVKSLRTE